MFLGGRHASRKFRLTFIFFKRANKLTITNTLTFCKGCMSIFIPVFGGIRTITTHYQCPLGGTFYEIVARLFYLCHPVFTQIFGIEETPSHRRGKGIGNQMTRLIKRFTFRFINPGDNQLYGCLDLQ